MTKSKSFTLLILSILFTGVSHAAAMKESPALLQKGEAAFKTNCTVCHGDKGAGDGVAGAAMNPKPRNFAKDLFKGKDGNGKIKNPTAQQVFDVITSGIKNTSMAPFAHISEEERWGLAYYVLKLRSGK